MYVYNVILTFSATNCVEEELSWSETTVETVFDEPLCSGSLCYRPKQRHSDRH